ncbi:class I SAM-dependent methyltransferase [Seonamhaeicola sp. NFXS20]|uniref:class I SAM-dependent methyltransferase n=1 Tax=unclassified Seonamhaeicola TaxID=2622645 RepID=UPI0035699A59
MIEMWDNRYSSSSYAYGINPNEFFKDTLNKYQLNGKILLPAEGEGRNAVFAAKKGFNVTAFDISIEGKNKALKLAEKQNVEIKYDIGNLFDLDIVNQKYDVAALIFAHFPPDILTSYHKKIADLIVDEGIIILEGFSKSHLPLRNENPRLGGPDKIEMLFSIESIKNDFPEFEIIKLEEVEVELNEGDFHNGLSKVIRFIGKKTKK